MGHRPPLLLTAMVTVHAEGRLLRPTLRSVSAALDRVVAAGHACELLVLADTSTDATLLEADLWAREDGDYPIRIVRSESGDPGSARNAGVASADGEYVALCDGDDLISSNYLLGGLELLLSAGRPTIVHPETLLSFGARPSRWLVRRSTDPSVTYRDLLAANLWPSSSIAHRSIYERHPYPSLVPGSGLGPEDWAWNLQTAAAGVVHDIVERSVFFYRTRAVGGVNNRNAWSLLPPVALGQLREALPLPDDLRPATVAVPAVGRRLLSRSRTWAKSAVRRMLAPLSPEARSVLRQGATLVRARLRGGRPVSAPPARDRREIETYLLEASLLEPAISWTAQRYEELEVFLPRDDGFGVAIDTALLGLDGRSEALVMVPWVGIGGADLVSRNYARALETSPELSGGVSMVATYTPERTLPELIPPGVNLVQLTQGVRPLGDERQQRFIAQLLVWAEPRLVVGVNCFDLVQALGVFHHALTSRSSIFLTLFAFDRIGAGFPVNPITDDGVRAFLDSIGGLLTDNPVTRATVSEMLALDPDRIRLHQQPALERTPVLEERTSAFQDREFDAERPFRLLWPHRLDGEKRPRTLVEIAARARAEGLPIAIDVYGHQVLSSDSTELLASFEAAGIEYKGPYAGGLTALPTAEYHALLLTSAWEGLPLVLPQSMLLGLPVIATAVGGIPELVVDGRTGFLTDGPDDVDGFIGAIRRLMGSVDDRRRIIRAAYARAVERHSWEGFRAVVDSDFGLVPREPFRDAPQPSEDR